MKNVNSYTGQRAATLINTALAKGFQLGKFFKGYLERSPITITRIKMTPDLRIAYCYFLPFNTSLSVAEIEKLLFDQRFVIRSFVTAEIQLKYSPELKFYYDHGFDNFNKVEQLLQKINDDGE